MLLTCVAAIVLLPKFNPPQVGMGVTYMGLSPWTDGIQGHLGGSTTITVTEGDYFDTSVTGEDTDEYKKYYSGIYTGENVPIGNRDDLGINQEAPHSGEIVSGSVSSTTVSGTTSSSITWLFHRHAGPMALGLTYPVHCIDRYQIYDNSGSSHVLFDGNVVHLAQPVDVAHV